MNLYYKDSITSFVFYREHNILCFIEPLFQEYSIKNVVPTFYLLDIFVLLEGYYCFFLEFSGITCEIYQFFVIIFDILGSV